MALSIKKPEVDELVRELCALTGETITSAIEVALQERLDRLRGSDAERIRRGIEAMRRDLAGVDWAAVRAAEDDMYDEDGLPR